MTDAESIAADLRADGQAMTLTRITPGEYDAEAGAYADATTQEWPVYGLDKGFGKNVTTIEGTATLTGDRLLFVSTDVVLAVPGDTTTFDYEVWNVLSANKVKGERGEVVAQKLHVRK